jgi:hypothetical protein
MNNTLVVLSIVVVVVITIAAILLVQQSNRKSQPAPNAPQPAPFIPTRPPQSPPPGMFPRIDVSMNNLHINTQKIKDAITKDKFDVIFPYIGASIVWAHDKKPFWYP